MIALQPTKGDGAVMTCLLIFVALVTATVIATRIAFEVRHRMLLRRFAALGMSRGDAEREARKLYAQELKSAHDIPFTLWF